MRIQYKFYSYITQSKNYKHKDINIKTYYNTKVR